jgi:hypothetical protein
MNNSISRCMGFTFHPYPTLQDKQISLRCHLSDQKRHLADCSYHAFKQRAGNMEITLGKGRFMKKNVDFWSRIGKYAEENPDLTYSLIKDIMVGLEELDQNEKSECKFG